MGTVQKKKVQGKVVLGIGKTGDISTDILQFDKVNPRLTTGDEYSTANDVAIISVYREIAALDELVASICSNGYINLEPLIVMGPDKGPFTVLEGNRRLAAIKVIKDPDLARQARVSVPQPVPKSVIKSIQLVSAHRVAKAHDAEAFIGFKHINGPQRWDAYAKARFVTTWFRRDRAKGLTIDQIARQTGDTNNTIRTYIASIFVLEQAEKKHLFDIGDRYNNGRFAFSHLYTALDRKEYQEFLGLEKGWTNNLPDEPVAAKSLEKLGEALRLIYGSRKEKVEPLVQSQNPDLKNLGKCLVNSVALSRLRAGDSLDLALSEVEGGSLFNEALVIANAKLEKAVELLPKYDGDQGLLNVASDIQERSEIISTMMSKRAGLKKRHA